MIEQTFQLGDQQVTLKTGHIARQAAGAVTITCGETMLLVAVSAQPAVDLNRDFFPLTVNYMERAYAIGDIPGGYFRREGRPTERETLISRLIDRPLRPLFSDGFVDDVQVVVKTLSYDGTHQPDVLAIIGAAAALKVAGLPFQGPVAASRVGYMNGEYVLNPSETMLQDSALDLVVAGTRDAVIMVESEAKELTEAQMLGAVMFGHQQMQSAIDAIEALGQACEAKTWSWQAAPRLTDAQLAELKTEIHSQVEAAFAERDKQKRTALLKALSKDTLARWEEKSDNAMAVKTAIKSIESAHVRQMVLAEKTRIDGRSLTDVRPIQIEVGLIPRAHGSALFTRGETQALVVATLGTERDAQMLDDLGMANREPFMLHYNFPPYCVGETGMMTGPKRREIGHGRLAKRALQGVVPGEDQFPYVLRVVSEITESNGSSSMATVCGGSLAMMDAGVPLKRPVAGIAMGLVKEGDTFSVLTDILGDEDHLGDMDFKVAGTEHGVTALQMDIKIDGITEAIMTQALSQAREGRMHILGLMNGVLSNAREELSNYAPRMLTLQIKPEKIRDVIGRGGATIRDITERFGVEIDISDDGLVKVLAVDREAGAKARAHIEQLTAEVEVGQVYTGNVVKIMEFGAFINLLPGQDGFLHISQIVKERVNDIHDYLQEGQAVTVKVVEIDKQGRLRVSMRAMTEG